MKDFLDKAVFVKLLLALLTGIFLQYFVGIANFLPYTFTAGLCFTAISFFISPRFRHKFNFIFGFGIFLLVCAFGIYSTEQKQIQSQFSFPRQGKSYIGTIAEIPQTKPRSIACRMTLADEKKHKILCYFQPDSASRKLYVGNRILFYAEIQAFKNQGNPDDFDYEKYMNRMGFSGTCYIAAARWRKLDSDQLSIYVFSQRIRSQVLNFYRKLNLGHNNFAVFSALTLGYKEELDNSVKQAFRTSGTSHILSVSGLHVAIIYLAIISLLNFLPKNRTTIVFRQLLAIVLLWAYAFLTGLPPSVVRATSMITLFCIAIALRRKAFSYNTICFAAFIILLYNPFDFFNIGFQLSFAAVLSICFFLPPLLKIFQPQNRIVRFFWETAVVSFAVQLGTYPICFYYFGTFPTYFFLTNIVIVFFATIAIYSSLGIYLAALLACFFPTYTNLIFLIPVWILKILLSILLRSVSFFESLPFALLQNISITLPQVFLLILFSISTVLFIENSQPKILMLSLSFLTVFLILNLPVMGKKKNTSSYIFNRIDKLEIGKIDGQNFISDTTNHSALTLIKFAGKKIAVIKSDPCTEKKAITRFQVDYLILSGKDSTSLYHLSKLFDAKMVVLDGTLSSRTTHRLQRECKRLQIEYHDVKENGAFRIRK